MWLDNIKEGKSKLHRWAIYLQSYNFTFEHVSGKNDELPDALSRDPEEVVFDSKGEELDALLPPKSQSQQEELQLASMIARDLYAHLKNSLAHEKSDEDF